MNAGQTPGRDAIASKGFLKAYQWLILRRLSQLSILSLFLVGPWFGWWIVKGNLSSSLTLDTLPLTDPFILLQSMVAGHWPESVALTGAAIVIVFYIIVGGRVYCSWVCPVNMLTDAAFWIREKFTFSSASGLSRRTRYWLLAGILLLTLIQAQVVWELVNPVSMLHRGLIFGGGLAWVILLAVFLFDLLISRRGWCSHLCPMGAFYSLPGKIALLRIRADNRDACNDCMDCYRVCPEHQVIRPVLKARDGKLAGTVINDGNCTNCGRCIDVCAPKVFRFGSRFNNTQASSPASHSNHSSGVEVL